MNSFEWIWIRTIGQAMVLVTICLTVGYPASLLGQQEAGNNSTRKIRSGLPELGKPVGSAIRWLDDYDAALAESRTTQKPIFWYVPTVPGTFMDRSDVVDWYMLTGPFSWPRFVDLINSKFVPLRYVPRKAQQEKFKVEVYQFVEPGFIIMNSQEEPLLVADRLTTLNTPWLYSQVAQVVNAKLDWLDESNPTQLEIKKTLELLISSNWSIEETSLQSLLDSDNPELKMLGIMVVFRRGDQAQAAELWNEMARAFPRHPLGWKAACEAANLGAFSRGFEVFGGVPLVAPSGTPPVVRLTSAAAPQTFSEPELWRRGTDYLLSMQRSDGAYVDSNYDFGGTDSLPNVYVAVTALAGMALIEAELNEIDPVRKDRIRRSIENAILFVANDTNLNFNDRDEILWAQAYRTRFLAMAHRTLKYEQGAAALQNAVRQLERLQLSNGSWYHEYANAFVSATALTALRDAQEQGAVVDSDKVESGLKRLASQRFENGAYPYATRTPGTRDGGTEQELFGSGGRVAICELAQARWGRIAEGRLENAVKISLQHHDLMAKALKYDDHTSTYAYGGFFFWYDMQARSEAITLVENQAGRRALAEQQMALILALPEIDGCFVDSHELGRCYGTSMALLSLSHLKKALQ